MYDGDFMPLIHVARRQGSLRPSFYSRLLARARRGTLTLECAPARRRERFDFTLFDAFQKWKRLTRRPSTDGRAPFGRWPHAAGRSRPASLARPAGVLTRINVSTDERRVTKRPGSSDGMQAQCGPTQGSQPLAHPGVPETSVPLLCVTLYKKWKRLTRWPSTQGSRPVSAGHVTSWVAQWTFHHVAEVLR